MRWGGALLLAGLVWTSPVQANEHDPLAPLRFLEGACWQAEFPDSAQVDVQCVAPMVDGHFLRSRHFVRGTSPAYWGETIYYWDGEAQEIRFIYFTSIGATSRGNVRFDEAGTGSVDERYVLPGGSVIELQANLSRPADGRYDAVVRQRNGADWGEATTMKFRRLPTRCRTLEEVRAACSDSGRGEQQ